MSESVTIEMFKIWADSQNRLLRSLSEDIKGISLESKETNKNIQSVVDLLKEDVSITKQAVGQQKIEFDRQFKSNDARFTNLFKRQEKIDKILIERAPAWVVFKSFRKGLIIFVSALIVAAASTLGGVWYSK